MLSPDDVRRFVLALPEAVEQVHHGRPSFSRRREDLRDALGRAARKRDAR
jgi:hypothetical protein